MGGKFTFPPFLILLYYYDVKFEFNEFLLMTYHENLLGCPKKQGGNVKALAVLLPQFNLTG